MRMNIHEVCVCLCACLSVSQSVCKRTILFALSVCLSICLSVCLSGCLVFCLCQMSVSFILMDTKMSSPSALSIHCLLSRLLICCISDVPLQSFQTRHNTVHPLVSVTDNDISNVNLARLHIVKHSCCACARSLTLTLPQITKLQNRASLNCQTFLLQINEMSNVDSLYRGTDFDGFVGTGFEIREILVHTDPTPASDAQPHYNMERVTWGDKELLQVMLGVQGCEGPGVLGVWASGV